MPEQSHFSERHTEIGHSTRSTENYSWKIGRARDSKQQGSNYYTERHREEDRHRDRERYDGKYDPHSRNRRSASPRNREPQGRRSSPQLPSPAIRSPKINTKPNFKPSGLLAAETNTVKASDGSTAILKYNEPPEARKPVLAWRLYVFKDSEQVDLFHIHRQSAYLVGRDPLVADITLDHPSCSKQHAAIQYRHVQGKDEYGSSKGIVKPFIIDLESTNGTIVNQEVVPAARYYELKAGDVIKFGLSAREYVLLHDEAS